MALECPNCKTPVARDGQRFCFRCGQDLRDYYESLKKELKESQKEPPPPEAEAPAAETPAPLAGQGEADAAEIQFVPDGTLVMEAVETTAATHIDQAAANHQATLRVLLTSGDVFDRELALAEIQIGKGPRNDIVIADPAVSTAHAVIRKEDGAYTISDLGSRNGTFINGQRISETRKLQHGDVIGMGLSKLTFRLSDYSETGAIGMTDALTVKPGPPPLTEDSLAAAVIAEGLASASDVERLRGPDAQGRRLYRALVEEKIISEEALRDLMSRTFGIPLIDLQGTEIDRTVAANLSAKTAREHQVFAFAQEGDKILLAVADPTDTAAVDEVRRELGRAVVVRLATQGEIFEQIDKQFGPRLIGVLPTGDKLEYFINQKEIEIGKATHNHISIADPTVSNTHAVILARDGGYSIVDLGSRNGTFINGERLGAHARTLRHGDTIQLGQTVLTFRNRAETTENITATLSPSALEEVRRRAESLGDAPARQKTSETPQKQPAPFLAVAPQADIAPQPVAAAQVISPVDATPKSIEADEEEKKKKKKKKKGADERIKSAYIGAVSRIVAQVFAVLLSVGLALYIANRSMSPSSPVETTLKGKPKLKLAPPAPGSLRIAGPLPRYQASGAVYLRDTDKLFFIVNDSPQLFWMQINEAGQAPNTEAKSVDIKANVADMEGITHDGSFFYIVGSQSSPEMGPGNALARFAFDPVSETLLDDPEVVPDLRGFLIENVPELKEVAGLDKSNGGINVEGIAWDDENKRLLLGFRSPIMNGKALLVPIRIALTRDRKMTRETLQVAGPTIQLPLENLGIRDIQYDRFSNSFLIIAGPPVSGGSFTLWQWYTSNEQAEAEQNLRRLTDLDNTIKPEGVARVKLGVRDFIFIVGDSGNYKKIDITETP